MREEKLNDIVYENLIFSKFSKFPGISCCWTMFSDIMDIKIRIYEYKIEMIWTTVFF